MPRLEVGTRRVTLSQLELQKMNKDEEHGSSLEISDLVAVRQKRYRLLRDGLIDDIGTVMELSPLSRPKILMAALAFIKSHQIGKQQPFAPASESGHNTPGRKDCQQEDRDTLSSVDLARVARLVAVGPRSRKSRLVPLATLLNAED